MLSAGPDQLSQILGLLHWFTARKRHAFKRVLAVTVHQFCLDRRNCCAINDNLAASKA